MPKSYEERGYYLIGEVDYETFTEQFRYLIDQYMQPEGEGETMASQLVTALNKLDYKYWNDGDVYDNSYHLEGWANDLSSYANWLYNHTTRVAQEILMNIKEAFDGEDYEAILERLFQELIQAGYLSELSQHPKVGSIYTEDGPFEWVDHYDEEDDWNYEDEYDDWDDEEDVWE